MSKSSGSSKAVAIWIGIGVIMLLVQVIIGGITRLTGSGLSITEWNIITGFLPPLNQESWLTEFNKYRLTPQFQLLNADFSLNSFKFIFFWEWIHRFWARLIGIFFIAGFIYLISKKLLKKEMIRPLIILFLLGALQGTVGWIMVASGLTGDAIYVKPARLALHFIFAMGLIAYAYWFLLVLTIRKEQLVIAPGIKRICYWILGMLIIQLMYGALMAGHKAATAAPTWPDINGSSIPSGLLNERPVLINFIDNKITIHFVHRTLAYVLLIMTVWVSIRMYRVYLTGREGLEGIGNKTDNRLFKRIRPLPMLLVTIQVVLGISAVVLSPQITPGHWGAFEWLAQLHQVTGILLVMCFLSLVYLFKNTRAIP